MSYYLIIVAYNRGVDHRDGKAKPYHWSLFIRIPEQGSQHDTGIAHQLHGMPGGFFYVGAEQVADLGQLGPKCNEVDIGSVPSSKLDRLAEICQAIPIVKDEAAEWNCQDWTIAAVNRLKEGGFIDSWITEEYIRGFLKEV